ncbi:MAG TPA: hypothetical protein VIH42_13425, partial [Thermoguttaceae bacterium]
MTAHGARAAHVCAFAWQTKENTSSSAQVAVAVAPRWFARLYPPSQDLTRPLPPLGDFVWQNTELTAELFEGGQFKDLFYGQDSCRKQATVESG